MTGKILLYYLSDKYFSWDELNTNGNEHMTKEFDRPPDFIIKGIERPVKRIHIYFGENSVYLYSW